MSQESKFLARVAKEREGLVKKTFSKALFLELMTHYINDPELKSHVMKVEKGEAVKVMTQPVKGFRKIVRNVLLDYGVDKQEAESIMSSYEFKGKDLEAMYDFMNDFIYYYTQTGRNYKIFDKEDITASIFLKPQKEEIKEYRMKENKVKLHPHNKLGQKSTCAKWNREEIDKDGKTVKTMKKVLRDLNI